MLFELSCTRTWIVTDLPHQIWEAQAADGTGAYVLFTRFLHNKLFFWGNNLLRCHLSYLSPDFLLKQFGFVLMVLFYLGIWRLLRRGQFLLLGILVLLPFVFVLDLLPSKTNAVGLGLNQLVFVGFGLLEVLALFRNLSKKIHKNA